MDVTNIARGIVPSLPAAPRPAEITRLIDAGSEVFRVSEDLGRRMAHQPELFGAAQLREAAKTLRSLQPTFDQAKRDWIRVTHPSSPWARGMGETPLGYLNIYWDFHDVPSRGVGAEARAERAARDGANGADALAAQPTLDGVKQLGQQLMFDMGEGSWIGGNARAMNTMRFFTTPEREAAKLFHEIDLNHDARIDIASEHERTFELDDRYVPTTEHDVFTQQLRGIDRLGNRDGVVTAREAAKFFLDSDSDHDGWISAADASATQSRFPVERNEQAHVVRT